MAVSGEPKFRKREREKKRDGEERREGQNSVSKGDRIAEVGAGVGKVCSRELGKNSANRVALRVGGEEIGSCTRRNMARGSP